MPSIPLSVGHFTDFGFRFRKNIFSGLDHWAPFEPEKGGSFFDYKPYSVDTILVDKEEDKDPEERTNFLLAKMYFRIDIDKVEHSR